MKLDVNKQYSGFVIRQAAYIDEIQSEAYVMEHTYSGARLLYLGNNDDNKVFSISFRTPPYDDTGVAHILEHSVLCGSRKYRLKEPFVELVKGSMNTFLNAMTYPDKTMYPVASRNAKDFQNLMDVYLDAVFYPLIYENPYTLRQEGWHYNIEAPTDALSYNGVVYNEMKGVFSSADALLDYEAMKALFPDTPYSFESGGHRDAIPELTQEAFEHFHTTYYSPENSFIYLYGDMDKAVEFLREKGLAGAAKKAGRIAAEGIVATALTDDHKKAVVVEVNAETDFVAKNEKFQTYVADVAAQTLVTSAKDLDAFLEEKWAKDETLTVKEALASQIAIIGENMNIRRFEQVEEANGFVASYIHAGGKIGVLIDVETDVINDEIKDMAKNVAMQAAALKPMFTSRDEVSDDYIAKETEILTAAAKNEKPDANDKIIEGMVKGRINKELKETCLLDQVYVKAEDGKQSVSQYVASVAKANSANIKVKKFIRFETGEGLEKKNEDFAAEVAKQMGM